MSVAQPLPIGFFFFGNFRHWLCQDYLQMSEHVLAVLAIPAVSASSIGSQ